MAEAVMGMLETAAVFWAGTREVEFTDDEHDKILEPLARVLYRMTPKVTKRVQPFMDWMALATVLSFYSARVMSVRQQQHQQRYRQPMPPPRGSEYPKDPNSHANGNGQIYSSDGIPGDQVGGSIYPRSEGDDGHPGTPGLQPNFRA